MAQIDGREEWPPKIAKNAEGLEKRGERRSLSAISALLTVHFLSFREDSRKMISRESVGRIILGRMISREIGRGEADHSAPNYPADIFWLRLRRAVNF